MSRNFIKLSVDTYESTLHEWKAKKSIENGKVKLELDNSFTFKKEAFTHFYEQGIRGEINTPGTLTDSICDETLEGEVKLNKGEFDLKECTAKKKIEFNDGFIYGTNNIFDCPANLDVVAFDGTIERDYYSDIKTRYGITEESQVTVEGVFSVLGNIPDRTSGGYNCRHRLQWISEELAEYLRDE